MHMSQGQDFSDLQWSTDTNLKKNCHFVSCLKDTSTLFVRSLQTSRLWEIGYQSLELSLPSTTSLMFSRKPIILSSFQESLLFSQVRRIHHHQQGWLGVFHYHIGHPQLHLQGRSALWWPWSLWEDRFRPLPCHPSQDQSHLQKGQRQWLITYDLAESCRCNPDKIKTWYIYFILKTHKVPHQIHLIVSGWGGLTEFAWPFSIRFPSHVSIMLPRPYPTSSTSLTLSSTCSSLTISSCLWPMSRASNLYPTTRGYIHSLLNSNLHFPNSFWDNFCWMNYRTMCSPSMARCTIKRREWP